MCSDSDIKIVGNKPSEDIRRHKNAAVQNAVDNDLKRKARLIGKEVAEVFVDEVKCSGIGEMDNNEMVAQRGLLLSFAATVGFESFIQDDTLSGLAQKSFLDTVKKTDAQLYKASSEMSAFSFYYLAYRRGTDTIRRIGQTFAMLCSHDGDPIFQEMGEALYCWFSSEVKEIVEKYLSENQ